MINLSSIKTYMYCPMRLYLEKYLDNSYNDQYYLQVDLKNLRIDIQDLIQKNMRKLTRRMDFNKIENTLKEGIFEYIKKSIKNENDKLNEDELKKIQDEIISETEYCIKLTCLKAKKAMEILNIDGNKVVELFFPNCIYTYLIRDPQLDLVGITDKIEIINGKYYPIAYKNTTPPLKGVWDGDAVELIANAILIEREFDTEVYVGFIEYLKIGERRPVVMDVNLRKSLFEVIHEINDIQDNKIMPKVKKNENKCKNCEYETICSQKEIGR